MLTLLLTFEGASPVDAKNKRVLGDKTPVRDRVGMWHIRYYTHQRKLLVCNAES